MFLRASVNLSTVGLNAAHLLLIIVTAGRYTFYWNIFLFTMKQKRWAAGIRLKCILSLIVLAAQERVNSTTSVVIVFSYMRSGSTFIGELFKQNDELFYIYEPLHMGHR